MHYRGIACRVVRRMQQLLVSSSFVSWQDNSTESKRARGIMGRIITRWKMQTLARAFQTWAGRAGRDEHLRSIARRYVALVARAIDKHLALNPSARACFYFGTAIDIFYFRHCSVVSRLQKAQLSISFELWDSKVRQSAVKRVKRARAEGRRQSIVMRAESFFFEAWKGHVIECRRLSHIQAKVIIFSTQDFIHSAVDGEFTEISVSSFHFLSP